MASAEHPNCEVDAKAACTTCKAAKAPMTIFASKSLTEHFVRGVLGIGFLYFAFELAAPDKSLWAFGGAAVLLGLSLWALRGCPVCWSVGLINTVAGILHRRQAGRNS